MNNETLAVVIAGSITLLNGPVLIAILSRRWKQNDELHQLKGDITRLFSLVDRIAAGLNIGLKNDQVIFEAFRKNAINGESETQDRAMDNYFRECAVNGFKADGKEG